MEKYRGMYNTAELLLLGQNVDDDTLNEMKKNVDCHDVCNMQYTSGTTERMNTPELPSASCLNSRVRSKSS